MLKRKLVRKIVVATSALFALFLIYLLPNKEKLVINKSLEYNENVTTSSIYLMDEYSFLGKTEVVTSNTNIEDKVRELLEILIKGGTGENKIPSGFASILSSQTKILSIKFENGLAKLDFSKELLEIPKELEQKMIEAIIYTVTSINEIDKVIIYVDGNILSILPQTKVNLPSTLDRNFGINKTFDFTNTKDINQVTIYYLSKHNEDYYYVPVTKYLNDSRDKIKIIIDELASNSSYNTNLLSYLNSSAELLTVEQQTDILELTFNSYLFNDVDNKKILEEVIYTICLSIKDNYDVKEVVFNVDDYNIKTVLNELK